MTINRKHRIAVIGILIAVFNLIVFILPFEQTVSFWIAYIFAMIALVSQEFVWVFAWEKSSSLKSKFLGIPLLQISFLYLIVQVIFSLAFIIIPILFWQAALIEGVVWLAICAILMIAVDIGRNEIERVDKKISEKVNFIKSLRIEVEQMVLKCESDAIKKELRKLSETIRYSDPMSDSSLEPIEKEISDHTGKLSGLVCSGDEAACMSMISDVKSLLNERNAKTKSLK